MKKTLLTLIIFSGLVFLLAPSFSLAADKYKCVEERSRFICNIRADGVYDNLDDCKAACHTSGECNSLDGQTGNCTFDNGSGCNGETEFPTGKCYQMYRCCGVVRTLPGLNEECRQGSEVGTCLVSCPDERQIGGFGICQSSHECCKGESEDTEENGDGQGETTDTGGPVDSTTAAIGQDPTWKGIVPCGRNEGTAQEKAPCTLCHLLVGIQRLFSYGLSIIIAIALCAFFIAGVMYMLSTGDEELMKKAKSFMISSMVGLTIVVGAWLIVNVSLWLIGVKGDLGVQRTNWFSFNCSISNSQETETETEEEEETNCTNSGGECVQSNIVEGSVPPEYVCPNGRENISNLDEPCQSFDLPPRMCCKP